MPALSQSLEFVVNTTSTVEVQYPNTATGVLIYNSIKAKGDGYFGSSDGFHTVAYTTTPTFIGTVSMQASLASEPVESDWFDITDTSVRYTAFDDRSTTAVDHYNFVGNFVWVRGYIRIEDGAVIAINYNH